MARIAGVNIPQTKVVHVALTYIYGIGKNFPVKFVQNSIFQKARG